MAPVPRLDLQVDQLQQARLAERLARREVELAAPVLLVAQPAVALLPVALSIKKQ